MTINIVIFVAVSLFRLVFLRKSSQNEQDILAKGGMEYGVKNSNIMKYLHMLFYAVCFLELLLKKPAFDFVSLLGAVLLLFSMFMLYLVAKLLGPVWTIKLMLVKDHKFVDHLLSHAYFALFILFPLYCITLYVRIKEEEQLLKEVIIPNGIAGE